MEATFIKFNKKSIFQNFISQNLELGTVKQRHPYFPPVSNASSPFPTADELPGSVVQTKSRTTISWYAEHWPVTYLLILLLQITPNCNLPREVDFVCCPGLLFTELSRVTPNADAFSGVLRQKGKKTKMVTKRFIKFEGTCTLYWNCSLQYDWWGKWTPGHNNHYVQHCL